MIGLIVARSKNNVIGKNGNIPWKIKGEQKQFRELTTGNVVIMGRKSYEEIGHPLPNRMNIVVSTTTEYQGDNLVINKRITFVWNLLCSSLTILMILANERYVNRITYFFSRLQNWLHIAILSACFHLG